MPNSFMSHAFTLYLIIIASFFSLQIWLTTRLYSGQLGSHARGHQRIIIGQWDGVCSVGACTVSDRPRCSATRHHTAHRSSFVRALIDLSRLPHYPLSRHCATGHAAPSILPARYQLRSISTALIQRYIKLGIHLSSALNNYL